MLGRNSSHFWGVVLETPDPLALAEFYSALMDWKIVKEGPDFVALAPLGDHVEYLAFQRSPDYEQPTWPNKSHKQQMMMHLDIEVPDLEKAVRFATEAGAREADHQPQDTVRVMLDPDGHPFCLYVDTSE
ncbi:VOC family protein [Couchioplanes caeruleus]|uniref:VOC family protein n=1 Tax=Couchioplanes caeruleus TaxID=56438 RepID=UPI0020C0F5E2|nr:VOC family protein [Couchioplanes caeruleus]UQU65521.1 VOC family protein [Couchioplanes caeruleus]